VNGSHDHRDHRSQGIPSKESLSLRGPARGKRVASLMKQGPIGVLAHDGDDVVGWGVVARRKVADTSSVLDGFPRVLMRLDLR
jgi:hypothetical protein